MPNPTLERLPGTVPGSAGAAALIATFALCAAGFMLAFPPLAALLGPLAGRAAAQLVFFAAAPAAALGYFRVEPARLYLLPPRPGTRVEALLFPALAVFAFIQYEHLQESWLYRSREQLEGLYRQAFQIGEVSPLLVLVAVAVVPGLCEEFLFRGLLLGGLRRVVGAPVAAMATSLVFAVVHADRVVILPIFLLGLLLASVTLVTRSILPAIAIHVANNGIAASLLLWPSIGEAAERSLPMGPVLLAVSVAAAASLLWIASRRAASVEAWTADSKAETVTKFIR